MPKLILLTFLLFYAILTLIDAIKPVQGIKRLHVLTRWVAPKQALKTSQTHTPQGKPEPCKLNTGKPRLALCSHTEPLCGHNWR
jgi:hypothetical protein